MNIKAPASSDIPALRKLWKEAFGDSDAFLDIFFSTAFAPKRCRFLSFGDEPVAVLYWFDCIHLGKPVAYFYAIATAKAYRGKGYCHQLMEAVHAELTRAGYLGTLLVPANSGLYELYQTLGYQTCCYIHEFSCEASSNKLSLRSISAMEYAQLRRLSLPSGGILQEHENIDFLSTQASFYSGDDFVLAAHIEDDHLFCIELLGNTSAACDILCSLGCRQGTFRTPGHSMPFAMYLDLSEDSFPLPSYFGLAFD